ncbi:MAG: DNA-binding protein [Halopseudomonas sp.]
MYSVLAYSTLYGFLKEVNVAGAIEEIVTLIDGIYEKTGRVPSQSDVRVERGSGSNTTINKALKVWRDRNGSKGLPKYLLEAARRMHSESVEHVANQIEIIQSQARLKLAGEVAARVELDAKYKAERKGNRARIKELERGLAETEKSLRSAESRYHNEQTTTAALQARVDDRNRTIISLKEDLQKASERNDERYTKAMQLLNDPHKLGVPLYASVRAESDLATQNMAAIDSGEYPFKVSVIDTNSGQYQFQGGPGGQYRAKDIDLYARVPGGRLICLAAKPNAWSCPDDLGGYEPSNPARFDAFRRRGMQ